jgi:hypothetical protein
MEVMSNLDTHAGYLSRMDKGLLLSVSLQPFLGPVVTRYDHQFELDLDV